MTILVFPLKFKNTICQEFLSLISSSKFASWIQKGHFTSPHPNPQQAQGVKKSDVACRNGWSLFINNPLILT